MSHGVVLRRPASLWATLTIIFCMLVDIRRTMLLAVHWVEVWRVCTYRFTVCKYIKLQVWPGGQWVIWPGFNTDTYSTYAVHLSAFMPMSILYLRFVCPCVSFTSLLNLSSGYNWDRGISLLTPVSYIHTYIIYSALTENIKTCV